MVAAMNRTSEMNFVSWQAAWNCAGHSDRSAASMTSRSSDSCSGAVSRCAAAESPSDDSPACGIMAWGMTSSRANPCTVITCGRRWAPSRCRRSLVRSACAVARLRARMSTSSSRCPASTKDTALCRHRVVRPVPGPPRISTSAESSSTAFCCCAVSSMSMTSMEPEG